MFFQKKLYIFVVIIKLFENYKLFIYRKGYNPNKIKIKKKNKTLWRIGQPYKNYDRKRISFSR